MSDSDQESRWERLIEAATEIAGPILIVLVCGTLVTSASLNVALVILVMRLLNKL